MRKLSIGLLTFALAATVFTSCKKDENAAPEITFANIDTTVYETTTDPYVLGITVTSEAGLKEVKISETKNGTTTTPVTVTDFPDESNYQNQYSVSGIPAGGITILVSATDKDDQNVTREIKITKKASATPLTVVTFTAVSQPKNPNNLVGAGGSLNFGSYVDLDGGKIYLSGDAKSNTYKSTIDVIFDQSSFFNNDATSSNPGFAAGTGTYIKVVTVDYANATSATLSGLSVSSSDKEAIVSTGTIIYFETATNKGLLKVVTLTPGAANSNSVAIEAKIMTK